MTKPQITIENFDIDTELKCKCGCNKFNYDNAFLVCLQAYRYIIKQGMNVTSGCRCIKHNTDEGGVSTSLHICEGKKASALDFWCKGMAYAYKKACDCGLFNEVIWYKSKNIIHIGQDPNQTGNFFCTK